jgi:predicted DNA-binding transcriptional regulator AlpA
LANFDCERERPLCRLHSISRAFFYELRKKGLAPREMRVGTRRIISAEAARDWRQQREGCVE